jgi:peptide/nickel transport system substrate-binding protein
LAEAGYADGFEVALSCPNDRYVNDEGICQAIVGMLARVGVRTNLRSQSKSIHFAELQRHEQDFYLLGWGVPTLDSHYVFNFLYKTGGSWNFTGYSNPELDELIAKMEVTIDLAERDQMIEQAWQIVRDDIVYLPLHHQVINWALSERLEMPIEAQDSPKFSWAKFVN